MATFINVISNGIQINDLDPDMPVKTNTSKQFISSNLEISEINGLQAELNGKLSSPLQSDLNAGQFDINNMSRLEYQDTTVVGKETESNVVMGNASTAAAVDGATSYSNIFIGNDTAPLTTNCENNIGIGYQNYFLNDITGNNNVAIGKYSQYSLLDGSGNTSYGHNTLNGNISGLDNTAIGSYTLTKSLGTGNTAIGFNSGRNLVTGDRNIFIGYRSKATDGLDRTIAIGDNSQCDLSNQCTIGDPDIIEIRPMSDAKCNLGSATNRFKDLYISTITNATGVDIDGNLTLNNDFIYANPFGEYYAEDNATATTITTVNTWTKVLGTTTAFADNESFTHSNNRLTYTGTATKIFHMGASVNILSSDGADIKWSIGISKNGTHLTGSRSVLNTASNTSYYSAAIQKFTTLATNDYVEIFVQNNTGTQNLTISDLNLFAIATPNTL